MAAGNAARAQPLWRWEAFWGPDLTIKPMQVTKRLLDPTAVHFVWPADTVATSSKEQRHRIIEAIKGVTDRPEEIHNCLLGEVLVYAKASMTAAQAAVLRNHPDVGAVTSYLGNLN